MDNEIEYKVDNTKIRVRSMICYKESYPSTLSHYPSIPSELCPAEIRWISEENQEVQAYCPLLDGMVYWLIKNIKLVRNYKLAIENAEQIVWCKPVRFIPFDEMRYAFIYISWHGLIEYTYEFRQKIIDIKNKKYLKEKVTLFGFPVRSHGSSKFFFWAMNRVFTVELLRLCWNIIAKQTNSIKRIEENYTGL